MRFRHKPINRFLQKAFYTQLLLFLPFATTFAQVDSSIQPKYIKTFDFRYEFGLATGSNTKETELLLQNPYYNALDFRLGFRDRSKNNYANTYRKPYWGIGWFISHYNASGVGNPNALYGFMTVPFSADNAQKLSFSYSTALGLAFNFETYDSIQNPNNRLIASNLNLYVHIGLSVHYRISEVWSMNVMAGLKHYSNGSIKLPNFGINNLPITVGLSYKLTDAPLVFSTPSKLPPEDKKTFAKFRLALGLRNYEIGDPTYLKSTLGVNILRKMSYKNNVGLSFDASYSGYSKEMNSSANPSLLDYWSFGLGASWEWLLSEKLYVPIDLGLYVHRAKEKRNKEFIYERLGLMYRLCPAFSAGFTIKGHYAVADYIEWTLTYQI